MSHIRNPILSSVAIVSAVLFSVSDTSHASAFQDYSSLGGTSAIHQWGLPFAVPAGMTEGPSGSPAAWSAGIASNGGVGDAIFRPVSGNTGFFSGGIYGFFNGANYSIDSATPLSGTNTLILQVLVTDSAAYGNIVSPVLNIGGQAYAADFTLSHDAGAIDGGGFSGDALLFQYQWDVSSLGPIADYSIEFGHKPHTFLAGLTLTESDAILSSSALAIPEPSTWCLLVGAGAAGAWHSRRRFFR